MQLIGRTSGSVLQIFTKGTFMLVLTPLPGYQVNWLLFCWAYGTFKKNFHIRFAKIFIICITGLQNMLNSLGLEFEGHPHSGLDDAKNIARVLVKMIKDGAQIRVNEGIAHDCIDDFNRDKTRLVTVRSVPNRESKQVYYRQIKHVGLKAGSECNPKRPGIHDGQVEEHSEKFDLMKLFQALPT